MASDRPPGYRGEAGSPVDFKRAGNGSLGFTENLIQMQLKIGLSERMIERLFNHDSDD